MKSETHYAGRHRFVLGLILALGCFSAPAAGKVAEYLQDDAYILGNEIHHFRDNGETVSVIVGDFRLTVGPRLIQGRKGVVWIDTRTSGAAVLHNLTVYVEDDAMVVEGDGTTTQDKLMLVRLHVQGRVSADGDVSTEPLRDMPLYMRACKVRQDERDMVAAWREKATRYGLDERDEAPLVVRPSAREPEPTPAGEGKTPEKAKTASTVGLEALGSDDPNAGAKAPDRLSASLPAKTTPPPPPTVVTQPVHFEAPSGVTIEKDPKDPRQRIAIVKGKVYISQGATNSKDFLELRSDSAVVFTRDDVKREKNEYEKVPYAPPIIGLSGGETVTGAYLEGDVIISRGDRKMTGRSAYYDFVNERAVVLEPVFRTIQEQRNIPIYVRAARARVLSPRDMKFYNAIVSTSDFKTPTYAMGAKEVLLRDETPYDSEGEEIGPRRYSTRYKGGRFDVRGFPVAYMFNGTTSFEEGHTALRKIVVGKMGNLGYGAESEWHLFRLLGLVKPEGVNARLQASGYEKGAVLGITGDYDREENDRQYSGYFKATGVYDTKAEDTFGDERRDIPSQHNRGWLLARHKEFLPHDWQIQAELSLLSDRTFLEQFFPDDFWTGKEQENLIYAKKQRDNWAISALMKTKLNRFLTQTESYPEVTGNLVGESLFEDLFTYYGEARLGALRYNEDTQDPLEVRSPVMARFDTRHELDLPLEINTPSGPLNVVPYAMGRLSTWSDGPDEEDSVRMYEPADYAVLQQQAWNGTRRWDDWDNKLRLIGEGGVRMNMNFWKIYDGVDSRLWDVHRLKHIVTPELVAFGRASSDVEPYELYPLSPNVESIARANAAVFAALRQRLQTKRGPEGQQKTVDWMRFDIAGAYFHDQDEHPLRQLPRFFMTRPEYSIPRSFLSMDYAWNISDSVALLSDMIFDFDKGRCATVNVGVAVKRDPRLSYYTSLRYIGELDSAVGTVGAKYRINKKYTIEGFEQFDFAYDGGVNLGSRVSIIRKFPRWYVGVTFQYDRRYTGDDEIGIMLALWPQGVPEARIGGMRTNLLNTSSDN
ncbi:MAG: hypothetical protein JW849_04970 [Phycisphaerae bacterium]|nr:hypothetical protein [Phycisphaerae bacterium]